MLRTSALGFVALAALACTQDFEQFRPGQGGAGTGGVPTTGGQQQGGGGQTAGGGGQGGQGGDGGSVQCVDPVDCGIAEECEDFACVDNTCMVIGEAAETPCSSPPDGVCDGNGSCVECFDIDQCDALTEVCNPATNTCIAAMCDDGMQNGAETDEDCGGGCPDDCIVGENCLVGADCTTGFCDTTDNPPTCQNCGGDGDCPSNQFCSASDICVDDLAVGGACLNDNECVLGNCVDGFCCDGACDSTCEACSNLLTGVANGTCSHITNIAMEPANECADSATDCLTGTCSGTSAACGFVGAGTNCGALSCTAGTVTQPQCNATGQCNQSMDTSCNGHQCAGNACDNNCNGDDAQCVTGYVCASGNVCKLDVGGVCTLGTQCDSGFCADGFCCNTACGGTCRRCDNASTGSPNGTCDDSTVNSDPDMECPTDCDGMGACLP